MKYTLANTKKMQGLNVLIRYFEHDGEIEKLASIVLVAKNGIVISHNRMLKPISFDSILSISDKRILLHKPDLYAQKVDQLTTEIVEKILAAKTFDVIHTRKKLYTLNDGKITYKRSIRFELTVYTWLRERTTPIKICPIVLIVRNGKSLLLTITQGRFRLIDRSYRIIFEEITFSDVLQWISEANELLAQEASVKKPLTGFAEIASLLE